MPSSLVSFKSELFVVPFWYRLNQVVLEKRPLNVCSVVAVIVVFYTGQDMPPMFSLPMEDLDLAR